MAIVPVADENPAYLFAVAVCREMKSVAKDDPDIVQTCAMGALDLNICAAEMLELLLSKGFVPLVCYPHTLAYRPDAHDENAYEEKRGATERSFFDA